MSLPADVVPGVTTGHLAHHADLHTSAGVPVPGVEGAYGHLAAHAALKAWHDAGSGEVLPDVTDGATHETAHEALHAFLAAGGGNPIPAENLLAGADSSEWDINGAGDLSQAGYARGFSVDVGETMPFAITGSGTVVDIYRIGWYGGDGWRKVDTITNTPTTQPEAVTIPDTYGAKTCAGWSTTCSWDTTGAVSGLHVAVARNAAGNNAFWIPFVVADHSRPADIVVKTSDSTWSLAYNYYDTPSSPLTGKTYYGQGTGFGINDRSVYTSYDRPIVTRDGRRQTYWTNAEMPFIRWAERNGLNVKYVSSKQLDEDPTVLDGAKVFVSSGHDEYWSEPARDAVEAFRDAGGHCLFMSANEVFWRTRHDANGAWCYKDTMSGPTGASHPVGGTPLDPVSWTGTWKDTRWAGRRPENTLTGTDFRMNGIRDETAVIDAATFGGHPFWRGTSVASGSNLSLPRVVGFEADIIAPTQPDTGLLAATTININGFYADDNGENYNGNGDLTWGIVAQRYASGALVVGFGTCQWSWALDGVHDRTNTTPSLAAQQATVNLVADLGCSVPTPQDGVTVPSPVSLNGYTSGG